MSNIFVGYAFCFLTALVVITGDYVLKLAADGGMRILSPHVILGGALYAGSAVMWYFAMRYMTLAQAGVAFSMLTLLALCVMGAVIFNEEFHIREYLGVACALAAMVLLIRVT